MVDLEIFSEKKIVLPELSWGIVVGDVGRKVLNASHKLSDECLLVYRYRCQRRCRRFISQRHSVAGPRPQILG